MKINSYSKIFAIGHRQIRDIFQGEVQVEEKVDGSQISFGVVDGELFIRSKGAQLYVDNPEKMFSEGIKAIVAIKDRLQEGAKYRGEYLKKPKHNTIEYERIPQSHIMIFDIDKGDNDYLSYAEKKNEAKRLGFECVPLIFSGAINDPEMLLGFLNRQSVLGKADIEGVVVKNYEKFTDDKKTMMGKYVSEKFKEAHGKKFKKANPGQGDIIEIIKAIYRTEARWDKAIQHMRDAGKLEHSPKDIGMLLKEIQTDVENECADEIKEMIFKWAMPKIKRGLVVGFPEYYKEHLLKGAFDNQG